MHKIDRSEVSLSNLFDGLEKLMEASLIQSQGECVSPSHQTFLMLLIFEDNSLPISFKGQGIRLPQRVLLFSLNSSHFEDKIVIKVDFEVAAVLFILYRRDGYFEMNDDVCIEEIGFDVFPFMLT